MRLIEISRHCQSISNLLTLVRDGYIISPPRIDLRLDYLQSAVTLPKSIWPLIPERLVPPELVCEFQIEQSFDYRGLSARPKRPTLIVC